MAITTAKFDINYYQFLTEKNEILSPIPYDASHLKKLYEMMVLVRTFDTKAIALQRTGQLGTFPSSLGQEAISTGIGFSLHPTDVFVTSYRDYATQFMRGVTMAEILSYWGGTEQGNNYQAPSAKEDFPVCIPIGSQCLHGAGVAAAFKIRKQPRAALVTCGDGATSQGDFYEALNVSGAWELPLVVVVSNNQWAISVPRHKQSHAQTLAQKGIAAGIDCEQVDGNDVIAVQSRVSDALKKAREHHRPTIIEAITYRLSDHTTADDASRYRDKNEWENAKQKDPILRLKNYLLSENKWTDEDEKTLLQQCSQKVDDAVKNYAAQSPEPLENMFKFHYDESHHLS